MEKEFEREVLDRLIKIETKLDEQDYKGLKKQTEDADNRSINNEKRISSLEKKVSSLESKPQKRYDSIINQIVTFFVGAILTIVAVKIGLK